MKLQDLFLVKMDPPTPIPNGQWRTPWRTPSIFPLPATATGAGFDSRTRPTPGPGPVQRLPRTPVPLLLPLADQGETLYLGWGFPDNFLYVSQ